ncbi:hypothetical protein KM043_006533 [Ampulex compressa]|nr:hypothetical protein KM043_006533 [Ampulex compressa]
MSTLMMPTTMTTMTNPGPIPAHSVPQKIEPPKLTAAATLTHAATTTNKSVHGRVGLKQGIYCLVRRAFEKGVRPRMRSPEAEYVELPIGQSLAVHT